MPRRRHFLFLQGNASHFFRRLAEALVAEGHDITRINPCGGDRLFWGGDWRAVDYRGRPDAFAAFVDDVCARRAVSDVILHNDCRPLHRAAIAAARRRGIRVHVFEEGYLRPHWLTLEREGINGFSRLPDDPDWYRETARRLPPPPPAEPVGSGLRERILYDFQWQAANYLRLARYPHYRTHRPYPIWAEYATWLRRLAVLRQRRRRAEREVAALVAGTRPFFLFPLQLDSDSQVRIHSPFGRLPVAIAAVVESFAAHAPPDSLLVIKNHPLDNAWINYPRLVRRLARKRGIAERVRFLDGGDLNALIDHARGTVLVNSTVGLTALARQGPVIALGQAIFDLPGLTFQGPLATFWRDATPPDASLLGDYLRVLEHACLVNGNYYTEAGMRLAIRNALPRLTGGEDVLAEAPPRRPKPPRVPLDDG